MSKEGHHVIPISIGGFDWKENIIKLSREEHKLIHDTQNIPYTLVRKFRKQTNHMMHMNSKAYVKELRDIHLAYFESRRLRTLPKGLIYVQRDSIKRVCKRLVSIGTIDIKFPGDRASIHSWLKCYHNCLVLRKY